MYQILQRDFFYEQDPMQIGGYKGVLYKLGGSSKKSHHVRNAPGTPPPGFFIRKDTIWGTSYTVSFCLLGLLLSTKNVIISLLSSLFSLVFFLSLSWFFLIKKNWDSASKLCWRCNCQTMKYFLSRLPNGSFWGKKSHLDSKKNDN